MPAPPHIRPSKDKEDAAAVLGRTAETRCVDAPPPAHARWLPVIEALLEGFLQQFDHTVLSQLPDHQPPFRHPHQPLFPRREWRGELIALHKICQMLARNPRLPFSSRGSTGTISIVSGCPRGRSRAHFASAIPSLVHMHSICLAPLEGSSPGEFGYEAGGTLGAGGGGQRSEDLPGSGAFLGFVATGRSCGR
jgi:hypothetical protein